MARNYNPKTNVGAVPDSITTTKYGGGEISSVHLEVKNAVLNAGLAVAPADGTAEETNQIAQSLFLHGVKSTSFQAAGTVDAITLTPVSGAGGVVIPADYANVEGARVTFIPTGPNTGPVTVSIGQTTGTQLGTKKLLDKVGADLVGAELGADAIEMQYDPAADGAVGAWLLLPWATSSADVIIEDHFAGMETAPAADADHDITIDAGQVADSTNASYLTTAAPITKQIDAAWAVGDNLGGLFSGTVAADTTYHLFIIEKDSDGSIDAGFDTSITAANIPAGYTKFRRVSSYLTDGSANIRDYVQTDDFFQYNTPITDINTTTSTTTAATRSLSVPIDLSVKALLTVYQAKTSTNLGHIFSPLDAIDVAVPALSTAPAPDLAGSAAGGGIASMTFTLKTNTLGQVRSRSNSTSSTLIITTLGYTDTRGK